MKKTVQTDNETLKRRSAKTYSVMRRIAELQIENHKLDCSVEQYIDICKQKTEQLSKH